MLLINHRMVKVLEMVLYECNDCESQYAVEPSGIESTCPFCHGTSTKVVKGVFVTSNLEENTE